MRTLFILAALMTLALTGGALYVYAGAYNVGATRQHTAGVYRLLEAAMRFSVVRRARQIEVPDLTGRATIERGLRMYHINCAPCHGAPGIAPADFALGMMPVPANLALTAREWQPAEIYWVVRHGIKTSGMPAWEFRLADTDLWAIVAFVATLPALSPQAYRDRTRAIAPLPAAAATPAATGSDQEADQDAGEDDAAKHDVSKDGDAGRGKVALQQYACVACHVIPGVVGATKTVGPSLDGIANRKYLAGIIPNTPENLIRWLRFPQTMVPHSAMPDLGVAARDARDIAMFLDTLR